MPKLLIVDDSALMRRHLRQVFEAAGDFEVHMARNGAEALSMAIALQPDVVTLDVNMPEMDGLTCLARLMQESPRPVVMVSSLTTDGAQVTLEALRLGAVDFIPKPGGTVSLHIHTIETVLVATVRAAASARIRRRVTRAPVPRHAPLARLQAPVEPAVSAGPGMIEGLVLIGSSTGGPGALEDVLPLLPDDFPWPVVVAQHMPASFTALMARRLDEICRLRVVEAAAAQPIQPGHVYFARGDADVLITRRADALHVAPVPAGAEFPWHPSVSRMVRSALQYVPPQRLACVLLTGMGNDGATEMADVRRRGGRTIAESEQSAVVWGMPGELVRMGGAGIVLSSGQIAGQLQLWSKAGCRC
ncbi:MAG: chemotaxis-specific protein-glutamate methyltransferase CheB [Rhodopila sp.]